MDITGKIKEKALSLGFDLVGVTSAAALEDYHKRAFSRWLKNGCAEQMDYMRRNVDKRFDPVCLMDEAKSVIVAGLNYKLQKDSIAKSVSNKPLGKVARYARYEDYHGFLKKLLWQLAEFIISQTGRDVKFKVCVDSAPLAERAFAVRAGLGFIGKNHMLINPELGPEILLGELIIDIELEPRYPDIIGVELNCNNCDKCIKACPTGALRPDGQFDARRCISYLTKKHGTEIEKGLAEKTGLRLFGCDECVLACPYQQKAPLCRNLSFKYYPDRSDIPLDTILNMDSEEFAARFKDSPLLRPGLDVLKRNVRICLGNFRQS
jgi:epoxyqueuosine reductase